jgi:hypothetical protein
MAKLITGTRSRNITSLTGGYQDKYLSQNYRHHAYRTNESANASGAAVLDS